jgi:hypothetical protein
MEGFLLFGSIQSLLRSLTKSFARQFALSGLFYFTSKGAG